MSLETAEHKATGAMEEDKKPPNSQKSPKKSNKPQMEKKRRERINNSLDELKLLILGAMKKDASYYSKLEKADILEMAVDHVRNLQKQIRTAQGPDTDPMAKYRAGFITCASEVTRMIMGFPGLDESVKFNVMKHLASCCTTDQRTTAKDTKIKKEVPYEPIRNQDALLEPIRSHEAVSSTGINITSQSQNLDSRTIGEKRIMYQQLLSRAGNARKMTSPELRISQSQISSSHFEYRNEEHKMSQFSPGLKKSFPPSVTPWTNTVTPLKNTTNVSVTNPLWADSNNNILESNIKKPSKDTSFTVPQKGAKSEGSLIKPVAQMPEKVLISGGIRFMPATVLVPVQVGYTPFDYKQKNIADEKSDVWRPWEKMENLSRSSKTMENHRLFSM